MKRLLSAAAVLLSAMLFTACGNIGKKRDNPIPPSEHNIYVDVSTGADTNPGTQSQPFKTITKGLATAATYTDDKTTNVNVAAGIYDASSGETFPLSIPDNTNLIGSESGTTSIDGYGYYIISGGTIRGYEESEYTKSATLVCAPTVSCGISHISISVTNYYDATVLVADNATAHVNNNTFSADDTVWAVNGALATFNSNTIIGWVGIEGGVGIEALDAATKVSARNNYISSEYGVVVCDYVGGLSSQLDLGTTTSKGNNTILSNGGTGVFSYCDSSDIGISAVGNTWHLNVQGADANGHYPPQHMAGNPTAPGPNFWIFPDAGIDL